RHGEQAGAKTGAQSAKASYRDAGVDYASLDAGKRLAMAKALSTSPMLAAHGACALDASRGEPAFVFELEGRALAFVLEGLGGEAARMRAARGGEASRRRCRDWWPRATSSWRARRWAWYRRARGRSSDRSFGPAMRSCW